MSVMRSYAVTALILVFGFTAGAIGLSHLTDAVVVSAEQELGSSTVIVIDAGHGGEDGGAVSCTGICESELNLQIAQRLDCLLGLLGCRTRMLRTEDTSLASAEANSYSEKKVTDLKNRAAQINALPDAIVISIHQNHFPQEKYRGAQVFYAPDDVSQRLAERTQECLRLGLDAANQRQIKAADGIYLMEHIRHPGILVECGFLSNPQEEQLLRTVGYQHKIVTSLAVSIVGHLTENLI